MSLETIIAKIEAESRAESQAILKKAQAQADAQLAEARKQGEATQKLALAKGEPDAWPPANRRASGTQGTPSAKTGVGGGSL